MRNSICTGYNFVKLWCIELRIVPNYSTIFDGFLEVDKRFIINFDETPIPFEFFDGATYDIRDNVTITGMDRVNGVTVEFNKTVYNNEQLMVKWINKELALLIDAAAFYKIKEVFDALDKYGINRALIPSGLIPLL
ncbi:hypothetical protein QBC45DRAFT_437964 [Copromyces sp. CBS 386.78]|nr:hypothetical protein QBC45DRAFT_437964 [Copromyces sp. CBS 386.78]